MSTTIADAKRALGLSPDSAPDAADVARAFERLARRYPPQVFPDRFRTILDARDLLIDRERVLREAITRKSLDLSWIKPYWRTLPPEQQDETSARGLLRDMVRIAFDEELPEDLDPDDDDDIDATDLLKLMEEMVRGPRLRFK